MSDTATLTLQTVLAAVLGAAVGSFLNVVVLRTQRRRSWLRGRSACPHCGHKLRWWEMIPLGSFVVLGGRCRHCHRTLSWQYLLVESITAAVFVVLYLRFGWTWHLGAGVLVSTAMILIAVYDGRWSLIPDTFSWWLIITAALWAGLQYRQIPEAAIGLGVGVAVFGSQYFLSRGRWVGSGDIFLGAGLGLLLGWRSLLTALVLAYLAGALVAATRLLSRQLSARSAMAFGPYLMAGGFMAWLFGPAIVNWYLLNVTRF